jgi:four helix bundle protein
MSETNEDCGWFEAPDDWELEPSGGLEGRAFQFAVRVIHAVHTLPDGVAAQVLVRRLIEAVTSMSASVERAGESETWEQAQRRIEDARDLGRETNYWIRMIRSSVADSGEWIALLQEGTALVRLLEGCGEGTGGEVEQSHGEGENE